MIGISKRKELKSLPEPEVRNFFEQKLFLLTAVFQVLWTFKAKSSRQKTNFDVNALELKLRKEKRDKPRSVQIYNKIGNFARIKGNSLISIECYRKALSINPTNSEVILNLARLLFHHGYLEDAIYLTRK